MFIVLRRIVVKEGFTDQIINQVKSKGILEQQEGFIDVTVMEEKSRKEEKEMAVMVRWESEEYWKQWKKSDLLI